VPLVLWSDEPTLHRGSAVAPVAVGANLGSALAPALIHHPAMAIEKDDAVTIAWTEPGPERRSSFPIRSVCAGHESGLVDDSLPTATMCGQVLSSRRAVVAVTGSSESPTMQATSRRSPSQQSLSPP